MYNNLLNIAQKAALQAGTIITNSLAKQVWNISEKTANDFVTEVDLKSEQEIIKSISGYFPDHGILAEESGLINPKSEYRWIIDPLDGTTNFIHNLNHYAVSIACLHKNQIACGVVYDPTRQEMFSASKGQGANLNNRRIRVANINKINGGLFATGIPFSDAQLVKYQKFSNTVQEILLQQTRGIRRMGVASLDVAYVACGRFTGFWEQGLKSWDMAAAAIIAREAGAIVYDFKGEDNFLKSGNIVVAPIGVMQSFLPIIQKNYNVV